jgi:hypothetical protein
LDILKLFCNNLELGIATKDLGDILFTRSAEKEVSAITRYEVLILLISAATILLGNPLHNSAGDNNNRNKFFM